MLKFKIPYNKATLGSAATSVLCLIAGLCFGSAQLLGIGAVGMVYVALWIAIVLKEDRDARRAKRRDPNAGLPPRPEKVLPELAGVESLVGQMLRHGRYALLLRPQIAGNLSQREYEPACDALHRDMAVVPEGSVFVLPSLGDELSEVHNREGGMIRVEQLFLDRYPVTNRQYFQFVQSGGYEQLAIWEPEVWPAILDFVDQTGCPGPRFWQNGRYAEGEDDFPVVGVCWYEASAFARWIGKRLPSDAEWVKAGAWPVTIGDGGHHQRRFPWGDALDPKRANLWGSGPGRVTSVHEFPGGGSVGGVQQLIGNVWEWTSGAFGPVAREPGDEITAPGMKNVRGGAFDTYFESQATCNFASGEISLARKHNIGFRSLGACDLAARNGEVDDEFTSPREAEMQLEESTV